MKDVEELFAKAVDEIERLINTKTVVGEPINVDGRTLIPLVSVGFGFGAGGGEGNDPKKGAGNGMGVGGGGGVKPVALVVVDADGVRVEPVKGSAATIVDRIADGVGKIVAAKAPPA